MPATLASAGAVFDHFVEIVLRQHVFSEDERRRPSAPGHRPIELSEQRRKDIARDKAIDTRAPFLIRVSGKGGRAPTPDAAERYARFRNVTLLDHLTSVVRGALVIAEIDLRAAGVAEGELPVRLARIAAIAFLHDADKILQRRRPASETLTPADVDGLVERYGIGDFLTHYGLALSGGDLLALISNAEVTQHDRLVPGAQLPSREVVGDCAYVRLADRLDGFVLDERRGAAAACEELATFSGLRTDALGRDWTARIIRTPQTPFLLDALQEAFADALFDIAGLPPLVETHFDGELTLVAPALAFDDAFEAALEGVARRFANGLRVTTNNRGARDILDGRGGVADLRCFFEREPRECTRALFVHRTLIDETTAPSLRAAIETHFDLLGLGPRWSGFETFTGQHFQPWHMDDTTDGGLRARLADAAVLAVGLACVAPDDRELAARVPDDTSRERELVAVLEKASATPPDWLSELPDRPHKLSRHTLLGLHAAGVAARDPDLHADLFGEEGLVETWLRGGSERAGILEKNADPQSALGSAARGWLQAQAGGDFFRGDLDAETADRCHFTNLPVSSGGRIDSKTALYGLNVSAFSGREGRPESHLSTRAQTLVSRVAMAEHRLRTLRNGSAGKDVPVFVSSPTSAGLFWSLRCTRAGIRDLDLYDVVRAKKEAGKKLLLEDDTAEFGARTAVGRFATLPTRLTSSGNAPGLVGFAAIVIDAARRSGRPIHIFRGLPRRENAFVAIDCLPRPIERAFEAEFGSAALRVEDLPRASALLRVFEAMVEQPGLGPDLGLAFADLTSRLGAGCLALATLDRADDEKAAPIRAQILTMTREAFMTAETDDPLIAFAKAMTRVQAAPSRNASNAERDLGMSVAIESLEGARRIAHGSRESLVAAIAGGLENELSRGRVGWPGRGKTGFPAEAAREAATLFVDSVWTRAFRGRAPASKARRSAFAIYRFSFVEHSRAKFAAAQGSSIAHEFDAEAT